MHQTSPSLRIVAPDAALPAPAPALPCPIPEHLEVRWERTVGGGWELLVYRKGNPVPAARLAMEGALWSDAGVVGFLNYLAPRTAVPLQLID